MTNPINWTKSGVDAMLRRIEDEQVKLIAYHRLGNSWKGDQIWLIDLEKQGDGIALKAEGHGPHFEHALRAAFVRFFDATDHGLQFDAALPAPEEIDDSVPF